MKLEYAGSTHTGLVRQNNEDAILMRGTERGGLFLVADGIGGRDHGEVVSALLRERYDYWWQERFLREPGMDFQTAIRQLKDVLIQANRDAFEQFGPFGAGSTLVLLFLLAGNCLYLSAGDSRIYHARRLSVQQVTLDDTYGNFAPERAEADARGKLMGAVGIRKTPDYSVRTDFLQKGDRFFLCSDGTYRFLAPGRMKRRLLLGRPDPTELVTDFSREIEGNGAGDNYSLIYIRVAAL